MIPIPKPFSFLHTVKQAFEIKRTALPWRKAVPAGIGMGLPSLIGYWAGDFQSGLLAGMGGFTYLYVGMESYALRAKKLFFILLGLTCCVGFGSLLAPSPILSAFVMGLIGAVVTFIFGTLKYKGPAAMMFVLTFAMAGGMPVDPGQAFFRASLVFLGGSLSWILATAGWLFFPRARLHDANSREDSTSVWHLFLGAFDKHSIVFLLSLRFGMILTIAALVAHGFHFNRSYWVPLSCAAVMTGSTVLATFHRAIQRSLGTIVGILLAAIILSLHPMGWIVSVAIMVFTLLTELVIVRNYAIALLFITPNALLMAETSSHIHNIPYFAGARIVDVIVGSAIGLIGVLLIGRRSASSRISYMMGRTIRSQSQFLSVLFSGYFHDFVPDESREQREMNTHLSNLRTVYETALGEVPRDVVALEQLKPSIDALEHFGEVLERYTSGANRPALSDEQQSALLLAFEAMAQATIHRRPVDIKPIPDLPDLPDIHQEVTMLQHTLAGLNQRNPASS